MSSSNKRSTKTNIWSVIVDIDGCLANWNGAFFDLLVATNGLPNASFGTGIAGVDWRPEFTTWDWPKTECGYTQEQIDAAWEKVDDAWWRALDPYPGAGKALEMLEWLDSSGKAQVTFVTGRYPSARWASWAWLDFHGFSTPHVLTTSRKEAVAKALAANGPVAVIEDKPTLIEGYANSTCVNMIYAILQPYNQHLMTKFPFDVGFYSSTLEAVKHFEKELGE